jgi:type IV pilus assembly protein PilV
MTFPLCHTNRARTHGATLIEVLIAVLILSFGLLAMGGLMGQAIQGMATANYRAQAALLADDLIERMRSSPDQFDLLQYDIELTYDSSLSVPSVGECPFPDCTGARLALWDRESVIRRVRLTLPAGGIKVVNRGNREGQVFVVWNEPAFSAQLTSASTDICPDLPPGTRPRCLMVPFKL